MSARASPTRSGMNVRTVAATFDKVLRIPVIYSKMVDPPGFEPGTGRLKVGRSTVELGIRTPIWPRASGAGGISRSPACPQTDRHHFVRSGRGIGPVGFGTS